MTHGDALYLVRLGVAIVVAGALYVGWACFLAHQLPKPFLGDWKADWRE